MNVSLRNVDERAWRFLKREATSKNTTIGRMLNEIVAAYKREKKNGANWERMLSRKGMLTKKEAATLRKAVSEFRSGLEFR